MFISLGHAQLDTEDVTDHRTFISSQVPAGAGRGRGGRAASLSDRAQNAGVWSAGLSDIRAQSRVCALGRSGAAEDTGVRTPDARPAPWFPSVSSTRQGRVRLAWKPRLSVKDMETWSLSLGVGVSVTLAGGGVTHLGP